MLCSRVSRSFGKGVVSGATDWGYSDARAWVSTKLGPALCGLAGSTTDQELTCTVLTSTGWKHYDSTAGDWGYPYDRAWVQNPDGTVSYCDLVGTTVYPGTEVRCTKFNGTSFGKGVVSGATDWGYSNARAWVSTKLGPALCGLAGSTTDQELTCTVLTSTGWKHYDSTAGDWGYPYDRAWVQNPDGTVSYCDLVGTTVYPGTEVRCTKFNGTSFGKGVVSGATDWGYSDARAWVSTKLGPALCGLAGSTTDQELTCTVLTSTGWKHYDSTAGDWGYPYDRAWVQNPDGTVSYCDLVGTTVYPGTEVRCTKFNGTSFGKGVVSGATDWGYSNAF